MYGIFEKDIDINTLNLPANYLIKKSK